MTCGELAQVLQRYLDGEVDATTASRVVDHLDVCRGCGLEAETYEALRSALRAAAPVVDPAPLARLRDFAQALARGEIDPHGLPAS